MIKRNEKIKYALYENTSGGSLLKRNKESNDKTIIKKGKVSYAVERHFGTEDLMNLYNEYVCEKIQRDMKNKQENI